MDQFYKTKMCPFLHAGHCRKGVHCTYAHNDAELRTTSNLAKTKLCPIWRKGACDDKHCPYAHGRHELQFTGDYFKTRLCRFWQQGLCLTGKSCRHAHGLEEIRPRKYRLSEREKNILSERKFQRHIFKHALEKELNETMNYLGEHYEFKESSLDASTSLSKIATNGNGDDFSLHISQSIADPSLPLAVNNGGISNTIIPSEELSYAALEFLDIVRSGEYETKSLTEQYLNSTYQETSFPLDFTSSRYLNGDTKSDVCPHHERYPHCSEQQPNLPTITVSTPFSSVPSRFPRAASTPSFFGNRDFAPWVDTIGSMPAVSTGDNLKNECLEIPDVDLFNFEKLEGRNSKIFCPSYSLPISSENVCPVGMPSQGNSKPSNYLIPSYPAGVAWKTLDGERAVYPDILSLSASPGVENLNWENSRNSHLSIHDTLRRGEITTQIQNTQQIDHGIFAEKLNQCGKDLDELWMNDQDHSIRSMSFQGPSLVNLYRSDISSERLPINPSVYGVEKWLLHGRA
ncbi:zinc finger (CCCH type) motif-containing protein [Cardiosporidium cionae]|uniref:Zinc finger (CCCH type) motif-containing protein n=1 Tax=Cardiosporidium cionae TaxID=476202 RepID=A0ABQ7JDY0_9APIC|nr:zinc finger (CCCH type) motif-containing protein [Cardiosporidium cionae]|eukprot:KAF8822169.1 zinc finger (CCCH type) motif-containing protein [Cardiosporidium cionae]